MLILNLMVAAWFAALIVVTSDGGVSVDDLIGVTYGGGCLFLGWVIVLAIKGLKKQKPPLRTAWVAPILFVLGGAMFITDSAFFLRFYPSCAALNEYVAEVRDHPLEQRAARRVGLFVARETQVLPGGVVRIITAEVMFDDTGVVFSAAGTPPIAGEDFYKEIGSGWWRWWRSW